MSAADVQQCWKACKNVVWELPPKQEQRQEIATLFQEFGWQRGLSKSTRTMMMIKYDDRYAHNNAQLLSPFTHQLISVKMRTVPARQSSTRPSLDRLGLFTSIARVHLVFFSFVCCPLNANHPL